MAKKMGRPKEYNIPEMVKIINKYVDDNKGGIPIFKECCLLNSWHSEYVYTLAKNEKEAGRMDLLQSIARCHDQKEVNLEKAALTGKLNPQVAMFSLRQLGWREKIETKISGDEKAPINIKFIGVDIEND